MGEHPECQNVTLETINNENQRGQESHYVATADINNMTEGFTSSITPSNILDSHNIMGSSTPLIPKDYLVRLYFVCIAILILYIVYRIIEKTN